MTDLTSCQHVASHSSSLSPALRQMVIWDWYDGPETGLLACDVCHAEFYFFMIDWSNDHSIRIFALQPLQQGAIKTLADLACEIPKWPVWMPQKLKFPIEADRPWIDQLDELVLKSRKTPSIAIAWDNKKDEPILLTAITDSQLTHAQQLLESDSATSSYDWFSYLELPR